MDRTDRPALRPVPAGRCVDRTLQQTRALVVESQHCLEESRALLDALPPRRLRTTPAG